MQHLKTILRDTGHSAFPVTRATPNGQVFVGTIGRDHLKVILRKLAGVAPGMPLEVTYEELQRRQVSQASAPQHPALAPLCCSFLHSSYHLRCC